MLAEDADTILFIMRMSEIEDFYGTVVTLFSADTFRKSWKNRGLMIAEEYFKYIIDE